MTRQRTAVGFTLIELLVVVIIVAVLAAVGAPLLSANIIRARASEADASMGVLRTGLRARLAEIGTFAAVPTFAQIGVNPTDLDGRYFNNAAYSIFSAAGVNYCVAVTGATPNTAPRAAEVQGTNLVQRSMDQNGDIFGNLRCAPPAIN